MASMPLHHRVLLGMHRLRKEGMVGMVAVVVGMGATRMLRTRMAVVVVVMERLPLLMVSHDAGEHQACR
jgi:hypothetical protein